MNIGKYVFTQITDFLLVNEFERVVKKYKGNNQVKHFTCWNQLMCMIFGQRGNRESLSDLVTCLESQKNKWYHLGFRTCISKSNLAYANEKRNWQIYAEFAYILIAQARKICVSSKDFELQIDGNVYAIDSTTIDLCLSVFWWAPLLVLKDNCTIFYILQKGIFLPRNRYFFIPSTEIKGMKKMLLFILVCGCTNFLFAQDRQHKIVFDFTKNDTANFAIMVRHAKNIMTATANSKLEIVCHGPGLDLLLKDKTTVQKEIVELHEKYNVVFVACEATMQRRNIDKGQLMPLAGTVPFANLEISSKQQEGWSYIKAGQ